MDFKITIQQGLRDCGPACLKMLARNFGKNYSLNYLKKITRIAKAGVTMLSISDAAEKIGFRTRGVKLDFNALIDSQPFPCILHWRQNHFVVVYKASKKKIWIADPSFGNLKLSPSEFISNWTNNNPQGLALLLEPTDQFFEMEEGMEESSEHKSSWTYLMSYILQYKSYFVQLILGLCVSVTVILLQPLLMQMVVDKAITNHNINLVYIILLAQLALFIGNISVEIIRRWLLLHIGARVSISLVSNFFLKLFKLPISFFESHITGDILRRINDHRKVEKLLTVDSLSAIFSAINVLLLSIVLYVYDPVIFGLFIAGSLASLGWMYFFTKKRQSLDYKLFDIESKNIEKQIELINGVNEIKLNNCTQQKRWEWEGIQARSFKINLKWLSLNQFQEVGSNLITQGKNLFISFFAAKAVIEGNISLGSMMSITLIIGQLNSPFEQITHFILNYFDAKNALKRIHEIRNEPEENPAYKYLITNITTTSDILIEKLQFNYSGGSSKNVLNNLNLVIPHGKVTAIVGASGSGKTTLLKLLLKFFDADEGKISIGASDMKNINSDSWRQLCGVVMQDGKIFSDTISNNIIMGLEGNEELIIQAAQMACLDEYIQNDLPMGYETQIGEKGIMLSKGQQQRLLLARAIYKNPPFFFLDEATSALDASNEKKVIDNLDRFYKDKTVVIIAHRLSTVKNADKIVVLNQGSIEEEGTHASLCNNKGYYYQLIKDQLELGS